MRTTKELNKMRAGAHDCAQKGITLIVLVITVIVMLILVSVTIAMAVNGGLFEYAGKAVDETRNAINAEQQLANGKIKIGGKWYASIDDYINNNPIKSGIEITPTEVTLKKKEAEDVEGEEVLTQEITASVFGMESEPEITWEITPSDQTAITLSGTTGKTVTITAVGIEKATVTLTAKCTYEGEEYEETRDVTLEIIKPKITASTMQSDLKSYLGQPVNYGVSYGDDNIQNEWEIFYADEEHIYIITKGYLAKGALSLTDKDGNAYNGTSDFTAQNLKDKYPAVAQGLFDKTYDPDKTPALQYAGVDSNGTSYKNMKATQYLLDSKVWAEYAPATNEFADWAIGGPTFELFVKSYNAYYPDKAVTLDIPTSYGYANPLSASNSVPSGTYLILSTTGVSSYWLASPADYHGEGMHTINGIEESVYGVGYNSHVAFRPVVCLDLGVEITWNNTTSQFDLSWATEN